ncbi:hypothetical protein [Aliivibrio fischeri]|uniref:hypothetical protein n=1 Tax=Aliivibrio fischeri TaxID=668 RepID=UPI00080DAB11|nr:hypothetical protein [Aliivibrio fischeri]OCH06588.1 hypothetical protein A6E11_17470 [Aliivibrio fischeri]
MKTKTKYFLLLLSALINIKASFAAEEKVDQLGLFINVNQNCPFTIEQINNAIEGEFLRARVEPSNNLLFNLNVDISCLKITNEGGNQTGYAVSYDIRYGTQTENGTNVLIETPKYGSMLIGGPASSSSLFFINAIKDSTYLALTDYLKMMMES